MGHENIGTVAKAGREFARRKGFKEGDLVFVEHYVACGKCESCHLGQYRHCENTDWRHNPDAIRYGYTWPRRLPSEKTTVNKKRLVSLTVPFRRLSQSPCLSLSWPITYVLMFLFLCMLFLCICLPVTHSTLAAHFGSPSTETTELVELVVVLLTDEVDGRGEERRRLLSSSSEVVLSRRRG